MKKNTIKTSKEDLIFDIVSYAVIAILVLDARHEYFRRILCELLGSWVENGEYPNDDKALRTIVEGISVKNAETYFNL